ncbi:MAG: gamma-glutamyltransferase [Gammaproteobacteria bacterium]|nr:gamma-glutamyltransferase [Gammaproteobacteria bacterium]
MRRFRILPFLFASLLVPASLSLAASPPAPATVEPAIGAVVGTDAGAAVATAASAPVTARHAMVVTAQHLATDAGVEILRAGGNAVDAAVAVGYALAVVQPCCGNIGGGGFMTIHLANGKNLFLNFRERAPFAAAADMYLKDNGKVNRHSNLRSFKAVGVPGTVMGLNTALERFGTMSRAAVMQPAIRLAEEGYVIRPGDARIFAAVADRLKRHPVAWKLFSIDGHTPRAGERLRQPQLAETLKLIAREGSKVFYEGPIAKAIVKASEAKGGIFTMKDFERYTVEWLKPITCTYRGYTIVSAPPPSSGGVTLCEMLNILSGWTKYPGYGFHSVLAVHDMVEAMRFAYADRNTKLGDPNFVDNPIDKLLSARHAAAIRARIPADRAVPSSEVHGGQVAPEGRHTTHYSIVDAAGNAVAVTYTLNSWFGTGIAAPGTGFVLNNEMDDFTSKPGVPNQYGLVQGKENAIAPGKRPLSSMTPTIVLRDGKPFMLTGSPGGSTIITTVLQTIVNVIDRGMNVREAVDAPRIHQQWLPDVVYLEPDALTPETRAALEEMGYRFRTRHGWGAAEAIVVRPDGVLAGASDRRRSAGSAAGY